MRLRTLIIAVGSLPCLAIAITCAGAQGNRPSCSLSAAPLRDIVTRDSMWAILFPTALAARNDTVLVLGTGGLNDARGKVRHGGGEDSVTVGYLLTNERRTATRIPAPRGLPTARYFRVRPGQRGWDVVFFVPDRDTMPGGRYYDDGTLWFAELRAGRWQGVERIGRVQKTVTMLPNSSQLTQSGPLAIALFYGEFPAPGGVIVWRRVRDRTWRADTLQMRFAPIGVTATSSATRPGDERFFWSGNVMGDGEFFTAFSGVNASALTGWSVLRRTSAQSMNSPVIHAVGDTLHVSWWEFDRRDPPSLWYQALDAGRENPVEGRQRVARGINDFTFLAVPEGARTRLVWAYRPPDTIDSAEVAVMANGEPKVIGRVAFPFGFLTNGVASGDRSFILATSPRPVPDGEPSASRTLEVRVSCGEGT